MQTYNIENRIASIAKLTSGDCTTPGDYASKWDFTYDGDVTRTATLTTPYDENGDPQTAVLTAYYFGGAYELTDGVAKKYYSFGGQTIMRDANGLQYFPSTSSGRRLTDHLGSTVAVTNASGTLTSQQRYLPFGGVRTNVTTPNPQYPITDLGYTGQRALDPGMGGLMDYKARFYSPMLGRFTQPDTITPDGPQGLNRYSYVTNNPVNFNDPTGHKACGDGEAHDCDGRKQDPNVNPHPYKPKPSNKPKVEPDVDLILKTGLGNNSCTANTCTAPSELASSTETDPNPYNVGSSYEFGPWSIPSGFFTLHLSGSFDVASDIDGTQNTLYPNSIQTGPLGLGAENMQISTSERTSLIFGISTRNPVQTIGAGYSLDVGESKVQLNIKVGYELRNDQIADGVAVLSAAFAYFLFRSIPAGGGIPVPAY